MATLVLTVIGDDRAGLVSSLAAVIRTHGGNWESSEMAELAGKFAGIVTVSVADAEADELIAALRPLSGLLEVAAHRGADDAVVAGAVERLHLLGGDRPGIVQEISTVLARHGVNVVRLHTETREAPMAGGLLFEATAEVRVPDSVDRDRLQQDLEQLANELMVDLNVGTEP